MKKIQRAVGHFVFVLLVFALGCGSSRGRGAPELKSVDEDLLALVPEGIHVVLWMDLVAFRASKLFAVLEELLGSDFVVLEEAKSLDPIHNGDELVLALRSDSSNQGGQFLALLKGKMTKDEVLASFSGAEGAVSEQLGSFASIKTPEFVVVALTEHTFAIGSQPIVSQVVSLAEEGGVSLREREGFQDFALGQSEVAKLAYRRGSVVPNLEQYGGGRPPIDFDAIASGLGILKLDKGLELNLFLDTETQMDAAAMAGELTELRDKLRRNMFVLFLGVDWILDRTAIAANKTSLKVDLALDENDLQNLLQLASRLKKIRELAGAMEGGSGMPFQLPAPDSVQTPKGGEE